MPGMADDRHANSERMDRTESSRRLPVEGTWRAHQVPVTDLAKPGHLEILEDWMKSYRAEELFDEEGRFRAELAALAPAGNRRMGANPHANGGLLMKDLTMPSFCDYAVAGEAPGNGKCGGHKSTGDVLRDVMKLNLASRTSASLARMKQHPIGWMRYTR
jgi:xylulose-5-phosphate/fructose-6-phosphate phosphoketolase